MSTAAGVGKSILANAAAAGREAASRACAALAGAAPDFCLVFGTSGYDQAALLSGVRAVTGSARLSGCTGEGVISAGDSDERDRAVSVLAVKSDALTFTPFLVRDYAPDPVAAGSELARQVNAAAGEDALGLLLFPDGLVGNCTQFLRALEGGLARALPLVGGAAGDAMTFDATTQYLDAEAATGAVAAVLVAGRGELVVQVSHGCQTVGLERMVTSAEGGWLHTIDGETAWAVYRDYLDGDPQDLNAEGIAHLSLAESLDPAASDEYGEFIVRTPLQLDHDTGALFFPGGGITAGTPVRIARRDPVRIREAGRASAQRIAEAHAGRAPALVLQFDCAGRGRILFGADVADEVVRPLQEALGPVAPWIGFHTYGEIATLQGRSYYHNYSVALCAVYERP